MHRLQTICIFFLLTLTAIGQGINTIQVLLPTETVERRLVGGETHRYQVSLVADEFLQIRVEQKGTDVVLKLVDANGKQLAMMDSPNGIAGFETLSWVAITAGDYEIFVSSLEAQASAGAYSLRRENKRLATIGDRRRVEIERVYGEGLAAREVGGQTATAIAKLEDALKGWRELQENSLAEMTAQLVKAQKGLQAYSEALKLYNINTPEAWQTAVRKFEEAGKLYHEAGDAASESYCLSYAGNVSSYLGEKQKARQFYEQALSLARAVGIKKQEGILLNSLGLIASFLGEKQKALELYNQALPIAKEIGDKDNEAVILNNIGAVYDDLGEKQKALEFYNQTLLITKERGNKNGEATALGNIGQVYSNLGEKQKALEFYNQALKLLREVGNKYYEATTLNNIGAVYDDLGEKQKALDYYNQVLLLNKNLGNKSGEAITLSNIGLIHNFLGERLKALDFLNQALSIFKESGDKRGEAVSLTNIGGVYAKIGETKKALEFYNQSLPLNRAVGDKSGEASTLTNIAEIYSTLGDKQKSLNSLNQVLVLRRAIGDKQGEAIALNNFGNIYAGFGDKQKAIEYLNQASEISKSIGDKVGVAITLTNLGVIYADSGEMSKALEYYNQSLALRRALGDKQGEAITLLNIGVTYDRLGEKQKALDYFSRVFLIFKELGDKNGEAVALNNSGSIYDDLGEKQKALEFYNQSLKLRQAVGDKNGEAVTLNNIGYIYQDLGDKQKALDYYKQALEIMKAVGDKGGEANALSNIGVVYSDLGEKQKALDFYFQSLPLRRAVGDKSGESTALNNIGKVYTDLGDGQKSLEYLSQSLSLSRVIGEKSKEANTLNNLMFLYYSRNNLNFAAFYGKQAVNVFQQLRSNIKLLDKSLQQSYLKSFEFTYRALADVLIGQGRFAEAEQVLALLKTDEFFDFVRRDAEEIKNLTNRIEPNSAERKAIERYLETAEKITALGAETIKLEDSKKRLGADFTEQARLDELNQKLTDANTAFRLLLKTLEKEFGAQTKKEIETDRALQGKLQQWGVRTVAISTILGADRYRVVLTTPKVQVDGKTEIKSAELNKKIFEFRAALQNPQVDPRPLGKELYDILVKPIEASLIGAEAKTLVWTLDGTLRYIPIAALFDGEKYLAQKYQNVVVTSTTRQVLQAQTDSDWRALGLGVSKASSVSIPLSEGQISFAALPGVTQELQKIVRNEDTESGILFGRRYVDGEFTVATLKDQLGLTLSNNQRKYNIIHFATHFRLGSDTADSFLLLGNNQALTLEQVGDASELNFTDVELVTLSACNTAFGNASNQTLTENNGKEVDSLATFIENRGAKAILATLWSVSDESTSLLMSEFYRLHKENPKITKAEAMQRAQIAMIEGKLKPTTKDATKNRDVGVFKVDKDTTQPPFKTDENAPFAHPYYWSPFVLIGNWR